MSTANGNQSSGATQPAQNGAAADKTGAQDLNTKDNPLTVPTPAEGKLTIDKLDKAAEWAAYAAATKCAHQIGAKVLAATSTHQSLAALPNQSQGTGGKKPTILLVGFPGALHAAGPAGESASKRLEAERGRYSTALQAASKELDVLLAEASGPAKSSAEEGKQFESSGPGGGQQAATAFNYGPLLAAAGAAIGGVPGFLAGATLPSMVAGVGALVGLTVSTLAYLRSDYEIKGADVNVSEQALRAALCGALCADGKAGVRLLDVEDVEAAESLGKLEETAWTALEVKSKVEALTAVLQQYQAASTKLEAQHDALWQLRWSAKIAAPDPAKPPAGQESGGAADGKQQEARTARSAAVGEGMLSIKRPQTVRTEAFFESHGEAAADGGDTPPPSADRDTDDGAALKPAMLILESRIAELSALQLRCTAATKKAAALTAAFDAWITKITATADGQPALVVRTAVREAVAASKADYLLYVSLHSSGAEATGRSKSLLTTGGAVTLSGHAAASFVLMDCATGTIAAGDAVGSAASIRHDAGSAKFKEWGYAVF